MKEDLLKAKIEEFGHDVPLLDCIYIIQTRRKHDSGYMCMEIIGTNEKGYQKKLATNSDIIDLSKIFVDKKRLGWLISIDVPEYNVMRIFSNSGKFKVNYHGMSSFNFDLVQDEVE